MLTTITPISMLITFEGIDGAGKSTQINKLEKLFAERNIDTLTLREPGGTEIAEKIRRILLESRHEITPTGELLLFSASRAELVQQVILPMVRAGKTVILDRFYDSTIAYQGYGRGIDAKMLHSVIALSTFSLRPDITFYLDLTPEEAFLRKFSKTSLPLPFGEDEPDRMERSGIDFYRKVRQGYLDMIKNDDTGRFIVFDAREHPELLHENIVKTLKARFGLLCTV